MLTLSLVITAIVLVFYLLYKHGTRNYSKWSSMGIPSAKYVFPYLGNTWSVFVKRPDPMEFISRYYNEYKDEKISGFYSLHIPILIVKDPEIIKHVTVKDFDYFTNRNNITDEDVDPVFGKNLVSLKDERWREMRNIMSPTFTSSKMKNMFYLIDDCGQQMVNYFNNKIAGQVKDNHKDGDVFKLEMKDLFTRFANDVIATAAFGLKVDSLGEPENEFYLMGKSVTQFNFGTFILMMLYFVIPGVMKKLKIPLFGRKANKFYTNLVLSTIKERDEKKIARPDMIHLLMQARQGKLTENGEHKEGLSDEDIVAQAALFYFAGFDTVSTFLSFAAYELAVNPDIQRRLQNEIDRVVEEDDGKLTYDGVMVKMKYLEQVCCEVLRKWPPGPISDRQVTKPYRLERNDGKPDVLLKVGDVIWLPVGALHHDPKYFPDPGKFDPERFNDENKSKVDPFVYIPFGSGPRNCIGMRFALMESKTCLVHILRNFNIEVVTETQIPLKLNRSPMQMRSEKGVWLGLTPRT